MPKNAQSPIAKGTSSINKLMPTQPNQSLIDGLRVLQFVMSSDTPVGVTDVEKQLGIQIVKSHRLLRTLAAEGYVRQVKGRKYAYGPAVSVLAAQSLYATKFIEKGFPILDALHERTNMLVACGILWNRQVTYLYHAEPDEHGSSALAGYPVLEATASRLGLIALAELDEDDLRYRYSGHDTPGFKSIEDLLRKLRTIKQQGYAYERTNSKGDYAVSVGIPSNSSAAIAIDGKIERKEVADWVAQLREVAEKLDI